MHPSALWAMGPLMMFVWGMPVLMMMHSYGSPFDERK